MANGVEVRIGQLAELRHAGVLQRAVVDDAAESLEVLRNGGDAQVGGAAAGDLVAEKFELGYLTTGVLFGAIIAAITFAYYVLKLNGILAFWLAYILTRPLGASFGDLMSQPVQYGGLGFGTTVTSFIFLGAIVLIVLYMTLTRSGSDEEEDRQILQPEAEAE